MSDVTFPNPEDLTPGYTWTNPATGVEYTWNGERWVIVDTNEGIDLQAVLTNGNVADEDIYLTNIASSNADIIDISPEKAKVIIATEGSKVPAFELQHYAVDDPSEVKLELDEDGTRFDIECDDKVNNIHFRFEEDDKFIINKTGDAVFTGKVEVQPGEEDNEVVTFKQLALLEEQIEDIAPSFERGQWEYTPDYPPSSGKYTLVKEALDEDAQEQLCVEALAECQLANQNDPVALGQCTREYDACMDNINGTKNITTNDWYESSRIVFSDIDGNGNIHRWTDIKPEQYIEVFNVDGSGGMVTEITKKNYKGDISHSIIKGQGESSGPAIVKIYDMPDGNPADFVHKSGDTMTGTLTVDPVGNVPSLAVLPSKDASSSKYAIYTLNKNSEVAFFITGAGDIGVHKSWSPTKDYYLAPKKYVDTPATYSWKFRKTSQDPNEGEMTCSTGEPASGDFIKLSHKTYNGIQMSRRRDVIYFGSASNKPLMTIWDLVESGYRHKMSASVSQIEQDGEGNFLIKVGSSNMSINHALTEGQQQWITIGGFF